MLPGASAANTACIRFAMALIGAQLVSPSTRVPTSISMNDSMSDTTVSQIGKPRLSHCTTRERDRQPTTHADHHPLDREVGAADVAAPQSCVKVFDDQLPLEEQRGEAARRPAVRSPATSPSAARRAKRLLRDDAALTPASAARSPTRAACPSPIESAMRGPTSMPGAEREQAHLGAHAQRVAVRAEVDALRGTP